MTQTEKYIAACNAVLAYDNSIAGHAARGEVQISDGGVGYASCDRLDELYADMVNKTREALGMNPSMILTTALDTSH